METPTWGWNGPLKEPNNKITLIAGQERSEFLVHREVAYQRSPLIKVTLSSDMKKGTPERSVYILQENSVVVVRLLVQWLYTDILFTKLPPGPIEGSKAFLTLAQLWVLGEKLLIPTLQNQAVQELEKIRRKLNVVPTNTLHYVYENTSKDSQLRRLLVDYCAFTFQPRGFIENKDQFPREMLLDLAIVLTSDISSYRRTEKTRERDIRKFMVAKK